MHKLQLALILLITTAIQASQMKQEGLRYPGIDEGFLRSLPQKKLDYYGLQLYKINKLACPICGSFAAKGQCPEEKKCALDKYRRANESLLQKNNNMAVKLLKESAPYLDISKVLLAYCYRYGIGTKHNKTASDILLDLVSVGPEEKTDMILHLEFLLTRIELGL